MLPCVVLDPTIEVVAGHAPFKEINTMVVVWLLLELEGSAVLHELLEFLRDALAELCQTCLNLLLLDSVVLFIL